MQRTGHDALPKDENEKKALATRLLAENKNKYQNILRRPCNPQGKYPGQVRYEVIKAERLGKGSYGEINESLATLRVTDGPSLFCKIPCENKQRVVKRFFPLQNESLKNILELAEYEYELMKRMDHLHVKPPVSTEEGVYMVMRKMPGMNLYNFLIKEKNRLIKLTLAQRYKLALALAIALKEQVHDKNIMHRDLSAKNIMVEKTGDEFTVNIIDFDLVSDVDHVRKIGPFHVVNTTIAPELRGDYAPSSIKSDLYSLARVISEIFRFDSVALITNCYTSWQEQLADERKHDIKLKGIFAGLSVNSFFSARTIDLLKSMGRYEPEKRCSLAAVIATFTQLYQDVRREEDTHQLKARI